MTFQEKQEQARQSRDFGLRSVSVNAIRSADGDESGRVFRLSFSSEEPYQRLFGLEILSHEADAVDLSRLNTIGVLLFNHDTDRVVGKILRAWVENGRSYADVEFDDDEDSEIICKKVRSGTLKATSTWYHVNVWEEVKAGETSTDGKFKGPCWIARKWTPLEASIVSVPADATVGVGRQYGEPPKSEEHHTEAKSTRSIRELQLLLNKSL